MPPDTFSSPSPDNQRRPGPRRRRAMACPVSTKSDSVPVSSPDPTGTVALSWPETGIEAPIAPLRLIGDPCGPLRSIAEHLHRKGHDFAWAHPELMTLEILAGAAAVSHLIVDLDVMGGLERLAAPLLALRQDRPDLALVLVGSCPETGRRRIVLWCAARTAGEAAPGG